MNALLEPSASTTPAPAPASPLLRTLVLCDLVDSTALTERLGDQRAADLFRKHDRLARALLPLHGGREIDKTDGFLLMFDRPVQAVGFALDYQRALRELARSEGVGLAARVGIHVGDVVAWDNSPEDIARGAKPVEVEGLVKPITSRLMQLALPNQILLSGVAHALAHRAQGELGERLASVRWRTHGRYRFKGVPDPIAVFEVGEEGHAPLKTPPWSGKAHREVPFWRRPATLGIELAVLFALLAVPIVYLLRPAPAIAFANRDWVVVGDLKNLTGDTRYDASIETAFRIGLEQSRYVNVLSTLRARETLELMRKDPDGTAVDRSVGSEIALRTGARALILPTIAEVGGRVRVTAEVVDPNTQTSVYSESADGVGAESVLSSLDAVNGKLRLRLGEATAMVSSDSKPLDKAATASLDALRAYSLGQHAYSIGDVKGSNALLQQALKIDPQFALARVSLASNYMGENRNDEALREITLAASTPDRLTAREAQYVEAWRALFGPPAKALDVWQALSHMYPDFHVAHGIYSYFAWQYGNRYADAIRAYEKSASPQAPHPQVREEILGTLYLGIEDHERAERHFAKAVELGFTRSTFRPAVFAARRQYDRLAAYLAQDKEDEITAQAIGAQNLRVSYLVDQGRWDDAWKAVAAYRERVETGSRSASKLRIAELGVRTIAGVEPGAIRAFLDAEAAAAAGLSHIDRSETWFHLLFAGYLAASAGDAATAQAGLDRVGDDARGGDYPVLARMRAAAEARIALAAGDADTARAALMRMPLDGTELYVTHVALMDAHALAGDPAAALAQAEWLAAHRGRAYTEYNADWVARPFNVAQSDLALLRGAELALELGDKARARRMLAAFRAAWRGADQVPFVAPRLQKVDAAL